MKFSFHFLILVVYNCFSIAFGNRHINKGLQYCYICDTALGQTDCKDEPVPKTYSQEVMPGGLGWPICYRVVSKDGTEVERGVMQHFDGTAHWKPDFEGCITYFDTEFDSNMTACVCYQDNCNDNRKLSYALDSLNNPINSGSQTVHFKLLLFMSLIILK